MEKKDSVNIADIENSIYRHIILNSAPRILGFGDRDNTSKTYGCFDRTFWHYKLIDFPNSRYQEAVLFLALLYHDKFEGNIYYHNNNVLQWIEAVISYWARIQLSDGSFNECYPFEHSFVATAFTCCAVSEALIMLKKEMCIKELKKAGDWLLKNNNLLVANQMAGALYALYNIYQITSDNRYIEGCQEKISSLKTLRNQAGYFLEYDGYDIGYASILLSYLSQYYLKTNDKLILEWIQEHHKFLTDKINDFGNYDFKKTSRHTQYMYPFSFAVFNHDIFKRYTDGLARQKVLNPLYMDDRFCIPFAIDFLHVLEYIINNICPE